MNGPAFDPTSLSLLERARSDDQDAWRQLVDLYGPLVDRWCKRSNLKDEDVADIFQETFRSVSTGLSSFAPKREEGSFRSWLRAIVRHKIGDFFRRLEREPAGRGGTEAQLALSNVPDPLAELSEEEEADEHALVVQRAMELVRPRFTPENWSAFWQVAIEGKSAPEVAAQLGATPQAIRQANYRVRRHLRLLLEGLND